MEFYCNVKMVYIEISFKCGKIKNGESSYDRSDIGMDYYSAIFKSLLRI